MYDGSSAVPEAHMAVRVTKADRVLIARNGASEYREVLGTYTSIRHSG